MKFMTVVSELGTIPPSAVPNWLQSPLKLKAWLYMEMNNNHDNC